jgi:hypothetical protein
MTTPIILGKTQAEILGTVGIALLQVKNARHMTLDDMGSAIGRTDDMVSKYIAGEAEMGFVTWLRALAAWPELADKLIGGGK